MLLFCYSCIIETPMLKICFNRYGMKIPLTDAESGVEQAILSVLNVFRYDNKCKF